MNNTDKQVEQALDQIEKLLEDSLKEFEGKSNSEETRNMVALNAKNILSFLNYNFDNDKIETKSIYHPESEKIEIQPQNIYTALAIYDPGKLQYWDELEIKKIGKNEWVLETKEVDYVYKEVCLEDGYLVDKYVMIKPKKVVESIDISIGFEKD